MIVPTHAISIMQPWGFAICRMGKRIENRTWRPPSSLIGAWIAIHASKQVDRAEPRPPHFGRGPGSISAIIAVARLVDVLREEVQAEKVGQRKWWIDRKNNIGHLFADVVELPRPIPATGALGYWRLDEPTRSAVASMLAEASTP